MLLDALVGLAFVAVALVLTTATSAMRLWWAAVGVAWWLGDIEPLRLLHQGVLVGALAGYPTGRPRMRGRLLLLGVAILLASGALGQAGSALGFFVAAAWSGRRRTSFASLSAALLGLWLAGSFVWSRTWPDSFQPSRTLLGYELVVVMVAVSLPVALWLDVRRRGSLADRVLAEVPAGLSGLEGALRQALGERALRLTRVGEEVVVEGMGAADPETVAAVDRAVSLTVAHEQALAAAAGRLGELEATRVRLLAAADTERARAVHSLEDQLSALQHCQASLSQFPDIAQEVAAAAADIDRIVAGLPPDGLGKGGIRSALAVLCARHPVPVRLELDERAGGSLAAETALFYACSEALANIAKHARAGTVVIRLEAGDPMMLTVTDDGVGGADARGTGLQNLMDRMATVGGSMRLDSNPGLGTRLVAWVPTG